MLDIIKTKLSKPQVYRRLLVLGFLLFAVGIIFENILLMSLGILCVILSKYGMRKEHKAKTIF